jgi:hypothetical protein
MKRAMQLVTAIPLKIALVIFMAGNLLGNGYKVSIQPPALKKGVGGISGSLPPSNPPPYRY